MLFTDLLVYGRTAPNSSLIYHRHVDLKSAQIEDNLKDPNAFCVLAAPKSFTIIANDAAEKATWVSSIKEHTSGCTTGGQKAALWKSDHEHTECPLCKLKFTVFRRRHHCRQCGGLIIMIIILKLLPIL